MPKNCAGEMLTDFFKQSDLVSKLGLKYLLKKYYHCDILTHYFASVSNHLSSGVYIKAEHIL